MTAEKRQEMKEYKEKALAYEQKLKGKRISLDSGVMTGSTEMQKLENYESPTNVIKELISDSNSSDIITIQNIIKTDSSISPETPTLISEKEHNSIESSSDIESINIKSENTSLIETLCNTSTIKPELEHELSVTNSTIYNGDNLNNSSLDNESISIKSADISLVVTPVPKNKSTFLNITNLSTHDDGSNIIVEQIPRLRSNSYTLSSPSPVMVAFLNSQVQQQLIEPKNLKNNMGSTKESKSEPIFASNECDNKVLKTKSISLFSITKPFQDQQLVGNFVKHKQINLINKQSDNDISSVQEQDDRKKEEGNIVTISDNYENHNSVSESPCKSMKHCCCSHSDDEYSLSSVHYKTTEELNLEAERLRIAKLEIEKRHQDELSNLIKKQREEQEQIAVRYYLILQSTSETSMDDSHYSDSFSKQLKTSSSIQSEMTVTNDKSLMSDTSSIISNCSINTNLACSSPRQKTPSRSPYLQQNIKFYHRMRGGLAKWTKAPTEVENSAATIINAGVRGYLTRRLLRTEKAQMLKKTILDSLKTALLMHRELKKQQPTESDLELHRRIINQVLIINIKTKI